MFGENASGKKVSLLNDNDEPPTFINNNITTTATRVQSASFARPKLPRRCRHSYPASLSSQHSKESSIQSSCSSISCSPRPSPPTPPSLARLDSHSSSSRSLNTPSPMSQHNYDFDSLDQEDINKNQSGGLPYYGNGFRQHSGPDDGNLFPQPMQDQHTFNQYNGIHGQHPLLPLFPAYPQQAPIPQYGNTSIPQYQPNVIVNPLAPPHHPSHHAANIQPMLPSLPPLQPIPPSLSISTTEQDLASTSTTTPSTPITATSATSPIRGASNTINNNTNTSNPAPAAPPKKKYPCPHAKEFKCTDTFTTSGHAARHGKKHTGEKNVRCPTCNKAFTRKDNMKQHERTHRQGHTSRSAAPNTTISSSADSSPTAINKNDPSSHKRTASASTIGSNNTTPANNNLFSSYDVDNEPINDDDDEDADGDIDMDIPVAPIAGQIPVPIPTAPMLPTGNLSINSGSLPPPERPPMGKTKLSEILEREQAAASSQNAADLDADGELDDDDDDNDDNDEEGGAPLGRMAGSSVFTGAGSLVRRTGG